LTPRSCGRKMPSDEFPDFLPAVNSYSREHRGCSRPFQVHLQIFPLVASKPVHFLACSIGRCRLRCHRSLDTEAGYRSAFANIGTRSSDFHTSPLPPQTHVVVTLYSHCPYPCTGIVIAHYGFRPYCYEGTLLTPTVVAPILGPQRGNSFVSTLSANYELSTSRMRLFFTEREPGYGCYWFFRQKDDPGR
jgi:hypothetical protein